MSADGRHEKARGKLPGPQTEPYAPHDSYFFFFFFFDFLYMPPPGFSFRNMPPPGFSFRWASSRGCVVVRKPRLASGPR